MHFSFSLKSFRFATEVNHIRCFVGLWPPFLHYPNIMSQMLVGGGGAVALTPIFCDTSDITPRFDQMNQQTTNKLHPEDGCLLGCCAV
jgi:hypothetical protein